MPNKRSRKVSEHAHARWQPASRRIFLLIFAASLTISTVPALAGEPAPQLLGPNSFQGSQTSPEARFYALADQYLQEFFKFEPSYATELGIHRYDSLLEDVSASGRASEDQFQRSYLQKLDAFDEQKMSLAARDDLQLLRNHIQSSLFESAEFQMWKRNPDTYSSSVGSTLFPLIKRDFAPLKERLQSVIAREKQMPALLNEGKKNIDRLAVPRIYAELADEQLPGIIDFFENDIPKAIKQDQGPGNKSEPALTLENLARFEKANGEVVAALKDYQKFVKGLLADPNACKGDYALGVEKFRKLLSVNEMIDEPLDTMLQRGQDELSRLQAEFHATAKEIDAKATPTALFELISRNHPQSDKLLLSVKDVLGSIRSYIIENKIVTIPGADHLIVEDTPPFLRATTFASMDAPGAFEKKAKEAFYFVTLPEPGWDKERTEEHMRAYTYPDLLNTSIHEAYPGHYVQSLWNKQLSTNLRRAFDCSSNAEGWAHYCEQMLLDQGFHQGDKQLRLIQIHDALLRCCRYIVAIKMHTQGMSVAQATDFFVREGLQERANAEREAKRGSVDPTYLVYTYGKLEILALRDLIKEAQGKAFDLQSFHDKFLSIGAPPLKIVKAEMLAKFGLAK